ncbi:MAG: AMP-binding protein [Deltaproteobacteria bacterium]|nr:AMP-binding protein [Deltaproteobacteria bacterium]
MSESAKQSGIQSHAGRGVESTGASRGDGRIVEASTFWALLCRRAERTPDRLMFVDGNDRRISFAEFRDRAERVAAGLFARGVRAGTRVSWQLPTRIDTVLLSVALSRLGAVQNPIIALYREREVGSLLRQTEASLYAVVSSWRNFSYRDMAEKLRADVARPFEILCVDEGLPDGDPTTLPPAPTDGDVVRWHYSTSGTTSAPKVVLHTDQSLIAGGTGLAEALRPEPESGEIGSIVFPYAHIGGPDYVVMALRYGLPVLLLDQFSIPDSLEIFRRVGVTMSGGSTAHYLMLLAEQRKHPEARILPALRQLSGGGAPMPPEVYSQVQEILGVEVCHGYGMTECPMITSGAMGDTAEQLANSEGAPILACEIAIEDAEGKRLPTGVDGEVHVRGPMVAKGYLDPELSRQSFRPDGFFKTGDRGHLRPDGHLKLTGRSKEMIIRKGENISPGEIEDVLMTHPRVAAVAVIGLPDATRGERVCAVVEMRPGMAALAFDELQALCKQAGLMTQKTPEQLEVVDALPRNPTMKILKHELVARFKNSRAGH